ncbi:MAG TPA: copper homeostasis membrane protein CopD [Gemmatimonadales bacterium]
MEDVLYLCRFVQFAAVMVIFGGSAFRYYALAGLPAGAAPSILAGFDARLGHLTLATAIVALLSALALLLCQAAMMAGSLAASIDPATITAVLFETRFGRVWCWHLLLAMSLVLACLARPRRRQPIVLVVSLLLLASLGWIGHAAMDEGPARLAHEFNQTIHLLSAGLWLGGLVPLGWLLRRARAGQDVAGIALTRDAIGHFSQMGYVAVALIALTGAINSLLLVGSLPAMFGTPYGRLLALKILLFLAMVVVALINRFRLAPRISDDAVALNALCRTIGVEQTLGLCILAVVSVLGTWPPAIHSGRP